MKALSGLKVLDLTRVLAGPYCTMVLADLGAEVVKIEVPAKGDDSRHFGPFIGSESAYFMSLNRNKESQTLNLKSDKGRELFRLLVKQFDILVENYRGSTMEKLGLGYEALREINPKLIYAAVSGFGHSGPYMNNPAYDVVVQGMGGLMSITGSPDGPPTRVGASMGDITAGLFATIGILAAVRQREITGKGQKVDVSMLDCQVAILENALARYQVSGEVPGRIGNRHPSITPFTSLPTSDGYVIIAVGNDNLWSKFCKIVDRGDLEVDPRFVTNGDRTNNWGELEPILEQTFRERTTSQWLSLLEAAGIPCGPINTVDKVIEDPQVRAREMLVEVEHPVAGKLKMAGCPVKMSGFEPSAPTASPMLGQHNNKLFGSRLGMRKEEIEALRQEGVI